VAPLRSPEWPPHVSSVVEAASRAGWTGHGSLAVLLLAEAVVAAGLGFVVYGTEPHSPADALHTL
jgi:hypothetical protein